MIAAASAAKVCRVGSRVLGLRRFVTAQTLKEAKFVFLVWKCVDAGAEELPAVVHETEAFLVRGCDGEEKVSAEWFEVANEAVDLLCGISPRFDLVAERILKDAAKKVLVKEDSPAETAAEETPENWKKVNEGVLTRFVFLLGQFALKLLQFSEWVSSQAKKARHAHEEAELQAKKQAKKARQNTRRSSSSFLEDEGLGLVTQADDMEDEVLEKISQSELVMK